MSLIRLPVRALTVAGVLIVLYVTFGFFIAPGLVRDAILKTASQKLTRPPTLRRVQINPLNLSVRLQGFALDRADGHRVIGFDELYLRFDPLGSLLDRGLTLARLHLEQPWVAVELRPGGALDLAELIRPDSTAPDTSAKSAPFHVGQLRISGGTLSFGDPTRSPPLELMAHPVDLRIDDLRTRRGADNALSLSASTAAGESLHWEARFTVAPFRTDGTLDLRRVRATTLTRLLGDAVPFSMPAGELDFRTHYAVDAAVTPAVVGLSALEADLRDWTIANHAGDTTVVTIRSAALRGGSVDATRGRIEVDSLSLDGGSIAMWMTRDHHVNFEAWSAPPDTAATPWVTHVRGITVRGLDVRYEDRQVGPPAVFELGQVEGRIGDFSTAPGSIATLAASTRLFDSGTCRVTGKIVPSLPSADLQVDLHGFPLRSTQPYMDHTNRIEILSGEAEGKGRFRFNTFGRAGPLMRYEGAAAVRSFRCVDKKLRQDLIRWRDLTLESLTYDVAPSRLVTRRVAVAGGYARVVVGPDQVPNLVIAGSPPDSAIGYSSMVADTTDTLSARIDLIEITDASTDFSDLSLRPNFSIGIQQLNGAIRGLSSFAQTGGEITLDGEVDRYAPATVRGAFNPLARGGHTDVTVGFKHIELTTFTPYSGKFMGYRIERGKLSLDLHYVIDGRQLVGSNKVVMEQLTLGEKVDSPDATHLPVRFAIALLKDRDGNIDLDLPVKGNLDDPKFSVMRIVLKVLENLVLKAVTSPFKALGALFGGGGDEQLDVVRFTAGAATLDSSEVTTIDKLARALIERPGLRLDVPAGYDAIADSAAIAGSRFDRQLDDAVQAARGRKVPAGTPASTEERDHAIERLYVAAFGAAPAPLPAARTKHGTVDSVAVAARAARTRDMEQRLRAAERIDAAEMVRLGQARALAVKDRLVAYGADPGQVFVTDAGEPGHEAGPTVTLHLALDGR